MFVPDLQSSRYDAQLANMKTIVLGGSGLALASTSNNTETAWNLIVQMIDPNQM
jgi:hypothetical protein